MNNAVCTKNKGDVSKNRYRQFLVYRRTEYIYDNTAKMLK